MRIEAIAFKNFLPFADAVCELPPRENNSLGEVQLLVGQNGTGKTRLLCLLAAACENASPLEIRTSPNDPIYAAVSCECGDGRRGIWTKRERRVAWLTPQSKISADMIREALTTAIKNVNGHTSSILAPPGKHSNCAAFAFRGMASVSDAAISAIATVKPGSPAEFLEFERTKDADESFCQSMANLKISAAMDVLRNASLVDSRAKRIMEQVEKAVTRITGRAFGFDLVPHPEVHIRVFWGGMTMRLGQMPDGMRSIIGWLVTCVTRLNTLFPEHPDLLKVPFILLLDEPEANLHPAWQRKVLPAAQALFPNAQIFAVTHSPFVISSVNEGWIHVLRANDEGLVSFDKPLPCSKGDSYLDVVEDILGVKEWYDPETEEMLSKFRKTRESVLKSKEGRDVLASQAQTIAENSDSLRDIMAREMHQVDRLLAQAVGQL